jgi:hypothetical protein
LSLVLGNLFLLRTDTNRHEIFAWAVAISLAGGLLLWVGFKLIGSAEGVGFTILLFLTLSAVFYAAWRGRKGGGFPLEKDRLADAINGLPQSIQIFDSDDRLVLISRNMNPDHQEIWRPGITFAELV